MTNLRFSLGSHLGVYAIAGVANVLSLFLLNHTLKQPCVHDCDDTQSKLGGAIPGRWWVPSLCGMKRRELT